jgi:amino acid permease
MQKWLSHFPLLAFLIVVASAYFLLPSLLSGLVLSLLGIVFLVYSVFQKFPGEQSEQRNQKKFVVVSITIGIFMGILTSSLLLILFSAAATGKNPGQFIQIIFPLLLSIAVYFAHRHANRKKQFYAQYGLNYEEEMEEAAMRESENSTDPIFYQYKDTIKLLYLLALDESVTLESLNTKYKELAGLYHPDRLKEMGEKQRQIAEAEFKRITHAKEVIKGKINDGTL